MTQLDWCVWYGDGTSIGSDVCSPFELPGLNVQVVATRDADPHSELGRDLYSGFAFYLWMDGGFYGADQPGLWDYLQRPGPRKVLLGRTIPRADYQGILLQAAADQRMFRKSRVGDW